MAKKRLKIDSLAKLRQYTQEQDPAQFLSTEWRQVVRALEQAYVETDAATNTTNIITPTTTTTNGFYATNDNTYTTSGNLPFVNYAMTTNFGTVVSGYIFRPIKNGKYWIEISPSWTPTGPPYVQGSWSSTLSIKYESGSILRTNTYFLDQAQGHIKNTSMGPLCVIADLTTTNGVYFDYQATLVNLDHLSFKIHCIGD